MATTVVEHPAQGPGPHAAAFTTGGLRHANGDAQWGDVR